jgi:hypothetical protein
MNMKEHSEKEAKKQINEMKMIFDHEVGGDTFLRNVGSYTDYTALYPRRRKIT